MKYLKLKEIVESKAHTLKENAGYSGAWNDGWCNSLLSKLEEYSQKLINNEDLRPSEYYKLNDLEVGEPSEFTSIIDEYKLKIAKNMMKNMKL